jgi:hypothetical protein
VLVKAERLQVYYDLDLLQRWALGKQTFFKVRKSQIRKFSGSLIPLAQIRKFLRSAIPKIPNPMLLFRYVYLRSRILIFIHPVYRNQDLGSHSRSNNNKKEGGGAGFFCCLTFFCSHKFHKIKIDFILRQVHLAHQLRIIVLFTQRNVTKISEMWVVSYMPYIQ